MTIRERWASTQRVLTSSVCTPAVRLMVVAGAGFSPDDAECELYPVVAIRTMTVRAYHRPYLEGDPKPHCEGSERELQESGWWLASQHEETDPLVVCEGNLADLSYVRAPQNVAAEVVACPWPPEEDEQRLASVIASVKRKAKEMVADRLRREAAQKERLADGSPPGERNLEDDLATCNAATPGPWRACGPVHRDDVVRVEVPVSADAPCGLTTTVWEVGQVGDNYAPGLAVVNSNGKRTAEPNARFIAEAREGWPCAILSALESRRVYRRLRQLVLRRQDVPEDVRQEVLRLCAVDDRGE